MRIAYIEPFSGASGDMLLGALFDAGLDRNALLDQLAALKLPTLDISVSRISQHGIGGAHAVVAPEERHHARSWRDIRSMIGGSNLPEADRERAIAIFTALAEAEATVHGVAVDDVHFHEVGALDTIVDIVGVVIGLRLLGVERVYSAPVHVGGGTVRAAHGIMPVPAPATARLLATRNVPVAAPMPGEDTAGELLTPTGAAILCTLAEFTRPAFVPGAIGMGFGSKQLPWANMLRITIGEMPGEPRQDPRAQTLTVLETNIDDMNPQFYELLVERCFAAGALDVWTTPIAMKKGRTAQMFSVLAGNDNVDAVITVLIEQSSTLGVRRFEVDRIAAERRIETVTTKWGDVRVKLKIWQGRVLDAVPEYDDCAELARRHDVGIRAIWNEAHRAGEVYVGRRTGAGARLTTVDPLSERG